MAKTQDHRFKGSRHGHGDHDGRGRGGGDGDGDGNGSDGGEEYDDPRAHKELERSRFRGGLPATPDMYARAREQWYRLPGSLVRPSMDSAISSPAKEEPNNSDARGKGQ